MKKTMNPILAAAMPLVRKMVTGENVARAYDSLTEGVELKEDEKAALIVTKGDNGEVRVGVYTVIPGRNVITSMQRIEAVDVLVGRLLDEC